MWSGTKEKLEAVTCPLPAVEPHRLLGREWHKERTREYDVNEGNKWKRTVGWLWKRLEFAVSRHDAKQITTGESNEKSLRRRMTKVDCAKRGKSTAVGFDGWRIEVGRRRLHR